MQTLEPLTLTHPFIATVLFIYPHSLPDHLKGGRENAWLITLGQERDLTQIVTKCLKLSDGPILFIQKKLMNYNPIPRVISGMGSRK